MSARSRARWSAAATFVAMTLALSTALAQKPPTPEARRARALFDEGIALSDEGKWAEALAVFQKSEDLVHSSSVRFNIGATLRALGRYVEARKLLAATLAEAETQKPPMKPALKKDVEKLLGEVKDKVVTVTLKVSPAAADVQMDGAPIAPLPDGHLEADPGKHVFVAKAAGYDPITVNVTFDASVAEVVLNAPKTKVIERQIVKPTPVYARAWFIATMGVIVAGAAAATIVVVTLPKQPEPAGPPSSTVERIIPTAFRF